MINYNTIHEWLAHFVERSGKKIRWALRRYRLRKGIKQYLQKPYKLTKEQKRAAKTYWKRYTRHFSPLWHELYYERTGVFDVRFVPEDIQFTEIEDYFNSWKAAYGIDNKNYYSMFFPEAKHPETLIRKVRGVYRDEDYNIIEESTAINKCREAGKLIVKLAIEAGKGTGVWVWETEDGIERLNQLIKNTKNDIVVQKFLTQSKEMEAVNPTSVQIIRVMTMLNSKHEIEIVKAFFQFGRTESKISQEILGGAQVSINDDGKLDRYSWDADYAKDTQHPNGLVYDGWKVPGYKEVCNKAIELHKKMVDFRLISWDFALDVNNEPVFIEMNIKYGGINAHQLGSGPLYGDKTDSTLNEVYGKCKKI